MSEAAQRITTILQRWAAAASRKAEAELPQRLNLWQAYLEEARQSRTSPREYAQQVRNRVIAERLMSRIEAPPKNLTQHKGLVDRSLRSVFVEGPFTWQAPLSLVYPQPEFWFLYGGIRAAPD